MRYLTPLLLFLLNLTSCSVAPLLESPRIKPGLNLELTGSTMRHTMILHITDSVSGTTSYPSEMYTKFGEGSEILPRIKFAPSSSIELGGFLWWFFLNSGWEGVAKFNILDNGSPVFFRNIAVALLAGSKGSVGEWNRSMRNWGGITVGTVHKAGDFEIECIMMPSFGRNFYSTFVDGLGSGRASFTDIFITTGTTISLLETLYGSVAVLLPAYQFNTSYVHTGTIWETDQKIDEVKLTPGEIGFNVNVGVRFGGRRKEPE